MGSTAKFNDKFTTIIREPVSWATVSESDSDWSDCPLPPRESSSRVSFTRRLRKDRGDWESESREVAADRLVEAEICAMEIERARGEDKLQAKRDRLRHLDKLLESQTLFAQGADLKARALADLIRAMVDFAQKDLPASPGLDRALEESQWTLGGPGKRLSELFLAARVAADSADRLCQLLEDFKGRKKELQAAIRAFQKCLQNPVPAKKRRRAEADYISALDFYGSSHSELDKNLSKMIEERRCLVQTTFSKLAPLQEAMVKQDMQFLDLWKEISEGFKTAKNQTGGPREEEEFWSS